ncbi:MAG: dipeptidyl peptidase 3 [Chromatiales bacterium]|nr:dipeptidyl peptidase 3 [Chromatiales bacterium]
MKRWTAVLAAMLIVGCSPQDPADTSSRVEPAVPAKAPFKVASDRFADIEVLRYQVPGFEELSLKEKKLVYYLSQAALSGRDIIWDQNYRHNLLLRKTLSAIVRSYQGDRNGEPYRQLETYAKRVWFANGIHHHYSSQKMLPEFDAAAFKKLLSDTPRESLPLEHDQDISILLNTLSPVLFDPSVAPVKVSLDTSQDLLTSSASNFYRDVTQAEAEAFYAALKDPKDPRPVSWGLNSQLAKVDGVITERVWKKDGMYSHAIEHIIHWLKKAVKVAENPAQKDWLEKLIRYYESGDLRDFDAYNIAWVKDTESRADSVNGFIEVYGDPLGYRGSWESMVSIKDLEASHRIAAVAEQAQWFEDHSSIQDEHKKDNVVGISAKVITIVMEAGDAAPSTPIGVNLPNANWIRKEHGSKSVTLSNIIDAYQEAGAESGFHDEFMLTEDEKARHDEHGSLAYFLDVDLHEVIGHASGSINPGVGTPKETLKSYSSTLEEARADLVALYFLMDPKLIELGLVPSLDVGKASYDRQIRNGLMMQLQRLKLGDDIQEAHMRNRQLIAGWVYEKGLAENVVEKVSSNGKTYFQVRDYDKLRTLYGQLLREIQRIKSEGDYEAGKALVETYGVKVDQELHAEVLARAEPLNIAAYSGFIQPRLIAIEQEGEIVEVKIEYPDSFLDQMLEYEDEYSMLPIEN